MGWQMTQKIRDRVSDFEYIGVDAGDLEWLCTTIEKLCDVVDLSKTVFEEAVVEMDGRKQCLTCGVFRSFGEDFVHTTTCEVDQLGKIFKALKEWENKIEEENI